jgi:hypothetical protein
MWREGLGAYKIITENKQCSYANHPATLEFTDHPELLWMRLHKVREEMLKRGYHPKEMPHPVTCETFPYDENFDLIGEHSLREWQTLEEQIEIIKGKGCKCLI